MKDQIDAVQYAFSYGEVTVFVTRRPLVEVNFIHLERPPRKLARPRPKQEEQGHAELQLSFDLR